MFVSKDIDQGHIYSSKISRQKGPVADFWQPSEHVLDTTSRARAKNALFGRLSFQAGEQTDHICLRDSTSKYFRRVGESGLGSEKLICRPIAGYGGNVGGCAARNLMHGSWCFQ